MGSRGPLPKEEGKRQNRRARSNLKLVAQHDPDTVLIPEAPAGISETQREAWVAFFSSELAQLVKSTDLPSVRRLWGYYQQHEDLTRIFDKGRMVAGSTGQPRLNPALDGMVKLETAIHRLENELGLTPAARMRLGIMTADAALSLDSLNERLQMAAVDEEELWSEVD